MIHPDLDADLPVGSQRLGAGEIDVGANVLQRHAPLAQPHAASHFGSAQAASNFDLDTFSALADGLLQRPFHGTAVGNPAGDLPGNVLSDQKCIGVGRFDLFDIQIDFLFGERLEVGADLFDGFTFAANQYSGFGSVHNDLHLARETFDLNLGNAGLVGAAEDQLADFEILVQLIGVLGAVSVPATFPWLVNAQTKPNRMYFTTHNFSWCLSLPASRLTCRPARFLLLLPQDYDHMRRPPQQRLETATSSAEAPLEGGGFSGCDLVNIQVIAIDAKVLLGVGHRGGEQLAQFACRALVGEGQQIQSIVRPLAAHQVNDQAHFLSGDRKETKFSTNISSHRPTSSSTFQPCARGNGGWGQIHPGGDRPCFR